MLGRIVQLHIISTEHSQQLAPETFYASESLILRQIIGYNTIESTHSKHAAIHRLLSPTGKIELLSFIAAQFLHQK